jgi:hypothetical protein
MTEVAPTVPAVTPTATTAGSYSKAIAGAFYNTLLAVVTAMTNGNISAVEWVTIAGTAVLSGLAIWGLSNKSFPYTKAITAAVTAAIGVLGTALSDGSLTGQELISVIVAIGGALGLTYTVPNAARSDTGVQQAKK